jgi:hypothetical protein
VRPGCQRGRQAGRLLPHGPIFFAQMQGVWVLCVWCGPYMQASRLTLQSRCYVTGTRPFCLPLTGVGRSCARHLQLATACMLHHRQLSSVHVHEFQAH